MGKRDYLAPERLRGEPATPASDLFALGGVLHELVTGSLPRGRNLRDLRPDAPPALERAVSALLDPDPAARSAESLKEVAASFPPFDAAGWLRTLFPAESAAPAASESGATSVPLRKS
jgi:serine/threonine-protein kinase